MKIQIRQLRRIRVFFPLALILLLSASIPLSNGLCLGGVFTARAAGSKCPQLVQQALDTARTQCTGLGRNKTCYGNLSISAQPQPDATNFKFNAVGDNVDVSALQSLQLSSFDNTANTWGIAFMRVLAALPTTAAGEYVTILLFGDVTLTDASGANAGYNRMQAFYFRNSLNQSVCEAVPSSGILIQSDPNGPKVPMIANGAQLSIGSTVFFQSQPNHEMIISTLSGSADVTTFGVTQKIVAGTLSRIPVGPDGKPTGPPAPPEAYDLTTQPGLAAQTLPTPITPAQPVNPSCTTAKPSV